MPEFIFAAGWAFLVLVVLAIGNRIISSKIDRDQIKQIDRNTRGLTDIRAELGLVPFQDTKVGAR